MPFRDGWLPVGILLVFVGFAAGEAAISGVGMVILALGGMARYWSRHLFDRVTLKITASERRAFIGEPVGIGVALENKKPLPLPWYQWRVALAEALPAQDETVAAAASPGLKWLVRNGSLGWYQKHEWSFTVHPSERGFHQYGPSRLRSADLLGAFPRLREGDDAQHIIVFPQVFPVEELGLPADRPFGERKGGNPLFEDPLRIAGLRDYRPGDPLRRIDWKATARNGDLQSRVYEPSATQQLYILVNIDTMSHAWEGYLRDDLERTVSVAASLAVWGAGARYAVGLLANGAFPDADRPIRLAPSRSREQLTRILEALAVIQPLTLGDLAGSIRKESGRMPAGSTIVVVASLIPQPLGAAIARLRDSGHHVFVAATSERALDNLPPGIPVRRVARPFDHEVVAGR
ncbi:MAG: DUF58 domain-containing protein [Tepidiformaceae bacterium]